VNFFAISDCDAHFKNKLRQNDGTKKTCT